ncbi:hypothetical protein CspHIS471_0602950 [Cutaneotrichosporon sp. HIS471]|nr:hypothetical protein CspHIS471_0602950 [Cutaneotrichosporon sp. HIS471]
MDLLAGEKLYIDDTQILDDAKTLASSITALGGTVVSSPEDATGILVNPSHPSFSPSSPHQIYYTWPAHCLSSGTRVDPTTLPPPILLNHWRQGYSHLPVTVYVSVNLRRVRADEEPRATKAAVESALAKLGALVVPKRSMADIMVIDRKTSFFLDKITAEVRKSGRSWQRFAEREWADAVVRKGRMLPLQNLEGEIMPGPEEVDPESRQHGQPTPLAQPDQTAQPAGPAAAAHSSPSPASQPANTTDVDMDGEGAAATTPHRIIRPPSQKEREEEARRQREDSFAEDDAPFFKKAPGRPAGKPRNEYTPEDDDLLCRYLALYHAGGSWSSRKTYQVMTDQYEWVARHTWQSWLERFKKNSVAFGKRVNRNARAGLDDSLKTVVERTAMRERAKDKGKARGEPSMDMEAGPSRKGKEKATETPKRRLVLSDDEDEEPRKKGPPRLALGRNRPGSGFPTQPPREGREPLFMPGPQDIPEHVKRAQAPPLAEPVVGRAVDQAAPLPSTDHADPSPEAATDVQGAATAPVQQPQRGSEQQPTAPEQQEEWPAIPPSGQQPSAPEKPEEPVATPPPEAPAVPASPTAPAPTQAPPSAQPLAASASPAPPPPTPTQPSAAQPPPSPSAYAPRPSSVADLIDRRRTPRCPRHTLATVAAPHSQPSRRRVLETISVPRELRTPIPAPCETSPQAPLTPKPAPSPNVPLTPVQLQQKLEAGREIVTHAAQTYRGYIDRWLGMFGVGQAEIMAAVEEVRARTDLNRAPLVFGQVERVLEERYGRV